MTGVFVRYADGYLGCGLCGCIVHPEFEKEHLVWHERLPKIIVDGGVR